MLSPASQARCGDSPAFVGVVIPANDESGSVAASVAAVRRAASHPALERSFVAVVVVDDSSSDTTADRAAAALGGCRRGDQGRGSLRRGRAAGRLSRALPIVAEGLDADGVWLATTDADTLVHPDWLARQLGWWRRGAAGVAGLVRPLSWEEQPAVVRRRYEARMARLGFGLGHPHVYAANLGLTKAAYLDAGGVAPIDSGEDHALWNALVLTGRRPVHAPDVRRFDEHAPRGPSS